MPIFDFTERRIDDDISLRKITENDLHDLFAVYSDAAVMKYASDPPFPDIGFMKEFFESVRHGYETGEYFEIAVVFQNHAIGTCSFHSLKKDAKSVEIGYLLNRNYWGKGIMGKAISELIEYLVETFELAAIFADIDIENKRSISMVGKLGFTRVSETLYSLTIQ